MSSSNNYQNVNYDIISRRHFIEEKNILIFEIIRNIGINCVLNSNTEQLSKQIPNNEAPFNEEK